jgi:hypothetical protein
MHVFAFAGFGAQLLGIAAWRQARGRHAPVMLFWVGLALLVASLALLIAAFGTSLGISWALLVASIAAYALFVPRLVTTGEIGRPIRRTRAPRSKAGRGGALGLGLRLLCAGPLYLIAALGVGTTFATSLPWEEANRLMFGGLIIPVVWALGALHATADLDLRRVLAVPIAIILVTVGLYLL